MSTKNKNTNTTGASAAVLPVTLATLSTQEDQLKQQLAALAQQKEDVRKREADEMANKVNAIPASLGVTTIAEAIAIMKSVEKGVYGAQSVAPGARKSRVELTDEQRKEVVALRKAGGPEGQTSVLAAKFNVSEGTLWTLFKDNGLTTPRAPATPAATTA